MKTLYNFSFALTLFICLAESVFAQNGREQGMKFYREGKTKEAVVVLERAVKQSKGDAEAWNALGLAYVKEEELKKGIRAFEKAISFDQQNAVYHTNLAYTYLLTSKFNKAQEESGKAVQINPKLVLAYYVRGTANVYEGDNDDAIKNADQAIAIDPDYSAAYNLKSDALLYQFGKRVGSGSKPSEEAVLLQQAKDVLEVCLKSCRNNAQVEVQRKKLDTLTVFHSYFSKNHDAFLSAVAENPTSAPVSQTPPDPGVTPMKILLKPQPRYTDKARGDNISGSIVIAVLFAESGQITHTLILKGLGGGLNEEALKAAYKIKFEPAEKDGKPFSQIKIVTYRFTIY